MKAKYRIIQYNDSIIYSLETRTWDDKPWTTISSGLLENMNKHLDRLKSTGTMGVIIREEEF